MTSPHGKLLVSLATYNELANLPGLVDEVFRYAPHADLLVVDDNSPDGTGQWCDERAGDDARVRCLHRPGKLGLGTATIAAMRYALDRGYELLLNLDADFSHHPRYIPDLLRLMEDGSIDVAIGSRYVTGGKIEGWPRRRFFASAAVNWASRWLLGLPARDCSGAYRCYRASCLARLDFDAIISNGYSFEEEILWRLKRVGARLAEAPITFVDRTAGESKINAREACRSCGILLRLAGCNLLGKS